MMASLLREILCEIDVTRFYRGEPSKITEHRYSKTVHYKHANEITSRYAVLECGHLIDATYTTNKRRVKCWECASETALP